ncbi:Stp1/IreP family PP2C-type Ser/Thr phosphatase [Paenibacillus sp. TRM 82003]|nr:Stp1/IreP family PP2C-type Ser/Thr phosphatase [Paenibacillus sp. TRM 82003]
MVRAAYGTDVGRVRSVNEDRVCVAEPPAGVTLAIVADGMGGHQAGDTASQMTVELVREALERLSADAAETEREKRLVEAIEHANAKVFEIAASEEQYRGMGTTLTAALVGESRIVIGHIGDSRAYYINHTECTQVTEDHTLVNELLKTGQLTAEEAAVHPRRNVLTRALGTDENVEVDVVRLRWETGDWLLLCSDGMSNLVPIETMKATVQGPGTMEEKVDRLIAYALEAGGDDNISAVLLYNE